MSTSSPHQQIVLAFASKRPQEAWDLIMEHGPTAEAKAQPCLEDRSTTCATSRVIQAYSYDIASSGMVDFVKFMLAVPGYEPHGSLLILESLRGPNSGPLEYLLNVFPPLDEDISALFFKAAKVGSVVGLRYLMNLPQIDTEDIKTAITIIVRDGVCAAEISDHHIGIDNVDEYKAEIYAGCETLLDVIRESGKLESEEFEDLVHMDRLNAQISVRDYNTRRDPFV